MNGSRRWHGGRQSLLLFFGLLLFFFHFELVDLGLDLGLEFVAGALEFVERFPHLAGDFRQLFGPEDQQGQHEDESGIAETHALNHNGAVGGRQREGAIAGWKFVIDLERRSP